MIFSIITMSPAATSLRFAISGPLSCVSADSFEPASWFVWERIRDWFDYRIKKLGVRNCAFPLFVSEDVLQREKAHIEGFAAEVAWVTHAWVYKIYNPELYLAKSLTAGPRSLTRRLQYVQHQRRSCIHTMRNGYGVTETFHSA